jgi:hypothetical protein
MLREGIGNCRRVMSDARMRFRGALPVHGRQSLLGEASTRRWKATIDAQLRLNFDERGLCWFTLPGRIMCGILIGPKDAGCRVNERFLIADAVHTLLRNRLSKNVL